MTATERGYRKAAMEFAAYGQNANYPLYGLVEEAGELLEAAISDDAGHVLGELGDCSWMLAAICTEFKISWTEVMSMVDRLGPYDLDAEPDGAKPAEVGAFLVSIEVSKIAGKVAKFIRKNDGMNPKLAQKFEYTKGGVLEIFNRDLFKRIVNVARIVIAIAKVLGYAYPIVLSHNIEKLTERRATGTIAGSGETVEERKANAAKETV